MSSAHMITEFTTWLLLTLPFQSYRPRTSANLP
jgi:hypothetical protein